MCISLTKTTGCAYPFKAVLCAEAGVKGGGTPRYIARAQRRELVGFRELSRKLASRSTASPADIILVLYGLADLIPELVKEGCSVKLDGIGIISAIFKCEGQKSPEEVLSKTIKSVKLHFLPDIEIKKKLGNCEFIKLK